QLRVTERDARSALRAVAGQPVIPARARLRFGPGRTCEAIARVLDRAIVRAEPAGLDPRLLVVAHGTAEAGGASVPVRRQRPGGGVGQTGWRAGCAARRAGAASSGVGPAATGRARPQGRPGRARIWWRRSPPPNLRGMPPSCVTRWPRSSTPTSA